VAEIRTEYFRNASVDQSILSIKGGLPLALINNHLDTFFCRADKGHSANTRIRITDTTPRDE